MSKYTKYDTVAYGGKGHRKPSESKKFKRPRQFHDEFIAGRSLDDAYDAFLEKQRKEKSK